MLPHDFSFDARKHPVIAEPNPMHELHLCELFSHDLHLHASNPIRTSIFPFSCPPGILNPCWLRDSCRVDSWMRDFHFDCDMFVGVKFPSEMTLNNELAFWSITIHCLFSLTFIPRHSFWNGVFQYEASFVSFSVKPASPFSTW